MWEQRRATYTGSRTNLSRTSEIFELQGTELMGWDSQYYCKRLKSRLQWDFGLHFPMLQFPPLIRISTPLI